MNTQTKGKDVIDMTAESDRDVLMRAIVEAGQMAGLIRKDLESVNGAQCVQIVFDMAEALRAQAQAANADAWRSAVDHELTALHSTADSFANPREAVRALIDWHISVERDPAVSEMARDAARYRWLRDPCSGAERVIFYCRGDYGRGLMSSAMLDAAIDAAMQRTSDGGAA